MRISVAPGVPARSPVGAAARNTFLSGPWSKKPDSPAVSVGFGRKTRDVSRSKSPLMSSGTIWTNYHRKYVRNLGFARIETFSSNIIEISKLR